jgi:hypothetical protein
MIPVYDLVEWLKAEPEDFDRIEALRHAAVAFVNEPGGRRFQASGAVVDNIAWTGGAFLLSTEPAGAVTFTRWESSGWAEVDSTGFVIDGRLVYGYGLTWYGGSTPVHLRASYTGGYAVDPVDASAFDAPEDIKQAVRMLVADWYRNPEGVGEVTDEVAVGVNAILRKYR